MLVCWTCRQTIKRSNPGRAELFPLTVVSTLKAFIKYTIIVSVSVSSKVTGRIEVVSDLVLVVVMVIIMAFSSGIDLLTEVQNMY